MYVMHGMHVYRPTSERRSIITNYVFSFFDLLIHLSSYFFFFFFFQAEDGIRDYKVTGVQTCALPIWGGVHPGRVAAERIPPGAGLEGGRQRVAQPGGGDDLRREDRRGERQLRVQDRKSVV